MLTKILLAAIVAGVLSGIFATGVQAVRVTPLILAAEAIENSGGPAGHEHAEEAGGAIAPHAHDAWAPQDGLERTFYTLLTNVLAGVAFSLILVAAILLTNSVLTLKTGLVWGLGGFIAFVLAPNFGLPPELPGMQAADLQQRQIWWVATIIATAGALLIFAFKQQIFWIVGGLALLLAPHIFGAPAPVVHDSQIPAELAASFAVATLVASFLFWLFLGGALGYLIERASINAPEKSSEPREML